MSFAMEMDRTVLLVDADVSKPTVLSVLGIEAEKGLLDLLEDKDLNPADVLIKTSVPNLTVLPAGRHNANATELLASETMARLLDDLAHRYHDRVILFDSPPLLVTTESSVLSTHMGQIVMVVEAGKTPQPAIKAALGMVSSCGYVGLLLNKAEARLGFDKYGYGYGYGYGRS
jgi:receptor protein-tyrosine kinase